MVKGSIKQIQENTSKMVKLNDKALYSTDEQQEIMKQLEDLVSSSKKEALKCKDILKKLEKETVQMEKDNPGSTSAQIRRNMLDSHTKQLTDSVLEYQQAADAIRDGMRDKIKRQVKLLDSRITDAQVDRALNSEDPGLILREVMGISDQALEAVAELEERHERMKAIEQGVKGVLELFQDLSLLVSEQQEHLDNIQSNVASAKTRTKDAEKNLMQAQQSQKTGRKCQCIALLGGLVVLIIIIAVGVGVSKST